MNASELRTKTPDELRDQLAALKKEAFNLRFQQATGQMENTARMRGVRRDTARVLTILSEKAAASGSALESPAPAGPKAADGTSSAIDEPATTETVETGETDDTGTSGAADDTSTSGATDQTRTPGAAAEA